MKVKISDYGYNQDGYRGQKVKVKVKTHDVINADTTLAYVILPVLKKFKKENKYSSPVSIDDNDIPKKLKDETDFKKWQYLIDQMIFSFEYTVDYNWEKDITWEKYEKISRKITKGFELFGKYYESLWI